MITLKKATWQAKWQTPSETVEAFPSIEPVGDREYLEMVVVHLMVTHHLTEGEANTLVALHLSLVHTHLTMGTPVAKLAQLIVLL